MPLANRWYWLKEEKQGQKGQEEAGTYFASCNRHCYALMLLCRDPAFHAVMIASTTWLDLSLHVFSCPFQTLSLFPYTNMRKCISPNPKREQKRFLHTQGNTKRTSPAAATLAIVPTPAARHVTKATHPLQISKSVMAGWLWSHVLQQVCPVWNKSLV